MPFPHLALSCQLILPRQEFETDFSGKTDQPTRKKPVRDGASILQTALIATTKCQRLGEITAWSLEVQDKADSWIGSDEAFLLGSVCMWRETGLCCLFLL